LSNKKKYILSLIIAGSNLLLSLHILIGLDSCLMGRQYYNQIKLVSSLNYEFRWGIDGISICFIVLTNLFIFLSIFSLSKLIYRKNDIRILLFFLQ